MSGRTFGPNVLRKRLYIIISHSFRSIDYFHELRAVKRNGNLTSERRAQIFGPIVVP